MNTKNLAASLLPVVFALASLGTVGCAADSESQGDVDAREPAAAVAPVETLAGSAGTPSAVAPAPTADTRVGTTASSLRLAVTDKGGKTVTYEVLEFDFGVDVASSFSVNGGASVAKPKLRPFDVVVRPNAKSPVLGKNLYGAVLLSKVVLQRIDAAGKATDLASLDRPVVTKMVTDADDDTRESYELQTAILTAMDNGAAVTVDLVKGTTMCTGSCTCVKAPSGQLGPYTQSGALGTIPKDSTRIDSLSVELHNEALTSPTGASSSKAVLDGISFERELEASGLCAMYYAGTGSYVPDLRIGIAGPVQKGGAAIESTTWDACYATVAGVGFSGSSGEAVREHVSLDAAGLLRTDLSIDPITGVVAKGTTMSGWSFVANKPITSCSTALPTGAF